MPPRRYDVRISNEAYSHLAEIFEYVDQQSPQNAALLLEDLLNSIAGLSIRPQRYKVYRRVKDSDRVVRSMPVPPYLVYYRVLEQPGRVRILSVRHGARRQPRSFP